MSFKIICYIYAGNLYRFSFNYSSLFRCSWDSSQGLSTNFETQWNRILLTRSYKRIPSDNFGKYLCMSKCIVVEVKEIGLFYDMMIMEIGYSRLFSHVLWLWRSPKISTSVNSTECSWQQKKCHKTDESVAKFVPLANIKICQVPFCENPSFETQWRPACLYGCWK